MGYPREWFLASEGQLVEFICPICADVLRNPVQIQQCQHYFCDLCIMDWRSRATMNREGSDDESDYDEDVVVDCPCCRGEFTIEDVLPAPKVLSNLINGLKLRCGQGCGCEVKLEAYQRHLENCTSNPENKCTGCGAIVTEVIRRSHNCANYLREQQSQLELQLIAHARASMEPPTIVQCEGFSRQIREEFIRIVRNVIAECNDWSAMRTMIRQQVKEYDFGAYNVLVGSSMDSTLINVDKYFEIRLGRISALIWCAKGRVVRTDEEVHHEAVPRRDRKRSLRRRFLQLFKK